MAKTQASGATRKGNKSGKKAAGSPTAPDSPEPASEQVGDASAGSEAAATQPNAETEVKHHPKAIMPVLYRRPVPLTADQHGGKGLSRKANFAFAADANSVPVNGAEFKLAMKFYPIVFAGTNPVMAVVILGLSDAENLFVDEGGHWREGNYIPAYVRRYPFIFMSAPEQSQFVLCIDEESDLIVEEGGQPLFEDGKPSAATDRALKFCSAYQTQSEATKTFAAALQEADLLVPNQAEIRLASGEKLALGGFRVVDEERFANLPDDTFLDWRKKGWLPLVYAHLFSVSNWNRLIALRGRPD